MSKTLAQLARLLSASNEQLFDRYIDIKLYRNKPTAGAPANKEDFAIRTPKSGIKPSITISGQFLISNTANTINITIYNISANVDTMAYNWVEVDAGYMNSGIHASFIGQITNCYMAKPNPNGELVITAQHADMKDLYALGPFEVEFTEDVVTTDKLVSTCLEAVLEKYPELDDCIVLSEVTASMAKDWKKQEFVVGKATRHFRSPMECIAWLNSLFASFTYPTGYDYGPGGAVSTSALNTKKLPPLRLGFSTVGRLWCTCSYSESTPYNIKAISAIGSAVLTSTSTATITAPFNPNIMPGEVIFIDSRYFKTRLSIEAVRDEYKNLGNLWYVVQISFTFSTQTTNTMTLQLVNTTAKITAQEG